MSLFDIFVFAIIAAVILLVLWAFVPGFRKSKLGRGVGKRIDNDNDGKPFR